MFNRSLAVLALLIVTAIPAAARVVSYAPYTDRVAETATHERTTRRFALIERADAASFPPFGQVILYDTQGDEPRAVFPANGNATIQHVTLFERKNAPDAPPLLLVTSGYYGQGVTSFSNDGGNTWKEIAALHHMGIRTESYGVDYGGPWTKGLENPTRIGNDQWPFIISANGVWAISAAGEAKQIYTEPSAMAIGQDVNSSRLLVLANNFTPSNPVGNQRIDLISIDGTPAPRTIVAGIRREFPTGWIAPDGSVYLLFSRWEGRFLYLHRDGKLEFVSGNRGVNPPPLGSEYSNGGNGSDFFAVPTHDFSGAWMIQKNVGEPTRLLRHTLTGGLQEMWSDVAAPDVEALIAGRSGETLLIQVHREHDVQEELLFVDPALAVWRVGQPAPKEYDELYLNEEANKGFVHVDVDRVAAGDPFVFNAGSFTPSNEGPTSPPIGGGGDVIQEWGVVRGSLKQRLILPGVARLPGAFGSNWRTDVTIYNPLDTPQEVEVQYAALGETVQPETVRKTTLTLQRFEIRFIPDALHALFQVETGGGALHFLPVTAVNVTGRTYSTKDGGTFGFGMQAIDAMNAASSRFPVTFSGAFPGDHFRTNILLTDTSGKGTEVGMNAYGVTGTTGSGTPTISAPPGGIFQYNGLGGTLGLFGNESAGLVVQPRRGTAIATVVAIDNRTNDPTYFPPDVSATTPRFIPVIGHVDGAHGAHFRSDLYLYNPSKTTQTVRLEAKQWNTSSQVNRQFTLLPNEARVIEDVLPTLFNMTGLARLRYWTDELGPGVRVTSRTYTVEESGATYGSLIPPLNNFQIATNGDVLEILGAGGGEGFRTNLGLVELSTQLFNDPINVRIYIVGSGQSSVDTFTVQVPRGGGIQLNDIFASRGIATPTAALLAVQILDPGLIGAYATLTDNKTNDTTYLGAQLAGKEE
ncbi:MAG TPA: hypothetical protein VEK57_25315 [Thermoanaerobaculia bacterium]|nr:hypothetical protein [Thermoanaerobaculia bacterium]